MDIRKIESRLLGANCYIITINNINIIIDPCISVNELNKYGINNVSYILLTHAHFDHILYLEEIVNKYNSVIYCHKNATEKIFNDNYNLSNNFNKPLNIHIDKNKFMFVKDSDVIHIDNLEIDVIYTPGHSSCSVCYMIKDEKVIFTGDTLFNRSIGRSDFYSGNSFNLACSLKKLAKLDSDYIIYPGHDESSTISDQLKYNTLFLKMIK